MTGPRHLSQDFSEARRVALDRAQLAGLTGAQCDDLDWGLLDLIQEYALTEGIAARLVRQGVPVSQLLRLRPGQCLLPLLRRSGPFGRQTLARQLARRMAAGGWQIASGNAARSPYPKKES